MVLAYHLILTGYGHWLPNDPRGSMSTAVACPELAKLAQLHFGRKYPQPPLAELRAFYRQAVPLLKHPVLWFDQRERDVLVQATRELVSNLRLTCCAGAILHNHAHFLVRKHKLKGEDMIQALKKRSGRRPEAGQPRPRGSPRFQRRPVRPVQERQTRHPKLHRVHPCQFPQAQSPVGHLRLCPPLRQLACGCTMKPPNNQASRPRRASGPGFAVWQRRPEEACACRCATVQSAQSS